jgi:hypothetical protein
LPAYAQSGSNKAAAEALFVEGRNLMAAGRFDEACPKFESSQELDPGLGTMLNLAECYEKTGKTASAWAEYREAIPLARAAGSKEREDLAHERAKALEGRLSTLTIRAMGGGDGGAALDVRRDGVSVGAGQLGTPIPVDPGEHLVEVKAEGKEPWSTKVEVGADAAKVEVEIPPLRDAAEGAGPATGGDVKLDSGTASSGSGQRTLAYILGGVGVVGLGVGTYFGLTASSEWDDAKKGCTDFPYECDQESLDARESASSSATLSTIGFVAGGALLATGAILFFTASSGETKTAIGVGPGSAFVRGTF